MPPGNFGTVDIGNPNNNTADISRQIREGVNASDLAYHGGRLELGDAGTLELNGETGFNSAIKDDLATVIAKPNAICSSVTFRDRATTPRSQFAVLPGSASCP